MKCICCGADNTQNIGEIPPVISFAGRLLDEPLTGGALVRCCSCGFSFRTPQLNKESLDELYRLGSAENWQVASTSRADWLIASSWLKGKLKPGNAILDIGCFDGGFLGTLNKSYRLAGIEIHDEAGKKARQKGIEIIGKDFADLSGFTASFDAVVFFDVIEHTQNPREFLEQMARLTREGGNIIFSTGNSDALTWRMLGSRYWYCTIGEHISFVNPRWCEWAAERLGLQLEKVIKFSHVQSSWKKKLGEAVKNLIYVASPKAFSVLRKMGLGGDEFRKHEVMLLHPPTWMTARDHFI
jgi:2-polyprenyl-3-methyl-5-hydroxy-6-metoxy-1,4-benzoquinol methylase